MNKWRHKFRDPAVTDPDKSFAWKSHVRQKLYVSLTIFIVKRNKIRLVFDNIYPEKY